MSNSSNIDEVLEVISQVLIRCFIIGIFVLFFWWGALALAGDLAYRVHSSIVVSVTREQFDIIHYTGMLLTKSAISILFLFPYIGIWLVIRKRK